MSPMPYLQFWQGALILAAVPLLHWALLRRSFAVSGRLTSLVDRWRHGAPAVPAGEMSQDELLAAIRAETSAEFGESAIETADADAAPVAPAPFVATSDTAPVHVLFFAGLLLGGLVSSLAAGTFTVTPLLGSEIFAELTRRSGVLGALVLFAGGLLVGFGTRMAGGCTSGHGLCGVSQMQKGSLVATAAFFGMGVVTSFAVAALS
jgi:uncharacterized membrane protein YedE/YeeE